MNNHLYLLLNGDYSAPVRMPHADDPVIAVDGGIRHTHQLAQTPTLWLGDFDSSHPDKVFGNIPTQQHPIDKDQTDLELALDYVSTHYPHHIIHLIGSEGDEPDHNFGNLWCLPKQQIPVILWQKKATIVSAHGAINITWQAPKGAKISLYAISTLSGIYGEGLRWPLNNLKVAPHHAHTARNEMYQTQASISWQQGYGLLFLPSNVMPQILLTKKSNPV